MVTAAIGIASAVSMSRASTRDADQTGSFHHRGMVRQGCFLIHIFRTLGERMVQRATLVADDGAAAAVAATIARVVAEATAAITQQVRTVT